MKHSPLKPSTRALLLPVLCSSILVACVSEETPQIANTPTQNNTISTQPAAVALTASDMTEISVQARANESQFSIEDTGKDLEISISYTDVVSASHSQIFLNTDNDTSTGFGFNKEAWGVIGADYMIQDDYLYLALSDNADWDWQPVARVSNYEHSDNQINMTVSKNLIGNPCGSIQAGTMGRNDAWGVEVMYPVAKVLTQISIASCGSDTIDPVDPIEEPIEEPVEEPTLPPLSPVGLNGDWNDLVNQQSLNVGFDTNLVLNGYQEVSGNDVYLKLTKDFAPSIGHIQIYLDTDNNPATGYQAWSSTSTAAEAGAEYMIEDGALYKYTGTGIGWSWANQAELTPYAYAENAETGVNIAEMKSIFSSSLLSGSDVGVLVMWMNADWTNQNTFSPNAVYSLQ